MDAMDDFAHLTPRFATIQHDIKRCGTMWSGCRVQFWLYPLPCFCDFFQIIVLFVKQLCYNHINGFFILEGKQWQIVIFSLCLR